MDDKERIAFLENRVQELEQKLKKYTAPASSKVYYERHKEEHKQRVREYKKRTNYKPTPEQSRKYYLTQKTKKQQKLADMQKLEETLDMRK